MSAASRARPLTRTVIVGALATAGLVLFAIPALAHITVTPGSAQAGSAAVLTFHVPNEESKANTTRVDMQIPAAASSGSDGTARGIAAGGVLIGLLGLALAALSWRRAKTPTVTEPLMSAGAAARGAPDRKAANGRRRSGRR